MKQIRQRLTYANVMSSIAVFFVLGGATAFAATKIGANEIKANSIKTGKIVKEAVTEGKIKNGAVTTNKIANLAVTEGKLAANAVTNTKIADNAVTSTKIADGAVITSKLANGAVTNGKIANGAVNSTKVDGSIQQTANLLSAIVENSGALVTGNGAVASSNPATGEYLVTFNRNVTECVPVATPRLVTTPRYATARADTAPQDNQVEVHIWDPAGAASDFQFNLLVLCP